MKAFPPTYKSVGVYICKFVDGLQGSTKSIHNVISYLRVFCHYVDCAWLSHSDQYRLGVVCKRLQFEDVMASKHAAPITNQILQEILESVDLADDQELLTVTLMYIAHDGLLRSGELFSGLRAGDIEWCDADSSFTIAVWRSKMHRKGDPERVRICDHYGPSAYKLLARWFKKHSLHAHSNRFIIPRVVWSSQRGQGNKYQLDFQLEGTTHWWRTVIKSRVSLIGLDPEKYTGHSFRPGGATDLFAMGVSYPVVKLMGRWKSDAAILYLRDAMEVAKVSAAAFGQMVRKQQGKMGVWKNPRGDFHIR